MIYEVTVAAPAINEIVTLSADSEEEAKALAVASALQRWREQAVVTAAPLPEGPAA